MKQVGHEKTTAVRLAETGGMVVAGAGGGADEELGFQGDRVSIFQNGKRFGE